jgi:uncharacterized protein (TIGR02757 family)
VKDRKVLRKELDTLYERYDSREYVDPDPLAFLYRYDLPADREIAGFIASSLAFGGVAQIMASVEAALGPMGDSPYGFLMGNDTKEFSGIFRGFRHRWASGEDLSGALAGLKRVINEYGSLENCFLEGYSEDDEDILPGLSFLVSRIGGGAVCGGNNCLLPAPAKGSACKRLNLLLRWMVREDGVDPGGWTAVPASKLLIPLDVHMHRFAGLLGFTNRKQGDIRTAREVTAGFRKINPDDPVKYDFSITRLGIRRDGDRDRLMAKLGLGGRPETSARSKGKGGRSN